MTNESRKKWKLIEIGDDLTSNPYGEQLAPIAKLLSARNIDASEVEIFLNPSLDQIPDPSTLHGANDAAKQILDAVKEGKKIFIHGDFDADGICATSILWEFLYYELSELLRTKVNVVPYIPSRVDEGYGLSESSINTMLKDGAQLIITVDCGVRDKELIQKYLTPDLQFIITDHHQPPDDLLEGLNYTVVHQLFPDDHFVEKNICGSTIALFLVSVIRSLAIEISKENFQFDNVMEEDGLNIEPAVSAKFESTIFPTRLAENSRGLDLAALATVTDMMPLTGLNRIIVKLGLDQMKKGDRVGLAQLFSVAKVDLSSIDSYHLGFVIGPRINAAGRIGNPLDAVRMLLTQDKQVGLKYALQLDSLNLKRQQLTEEILQMAIKQIKESPDTVLNFIVGEGWPEGIIGLVAGKLQEQFGRPTIVLTKNGKEMRASARSLKGLNITDLLGEFSHYLLKFGGHELAAGFTVKEGCLEALQSEIKLRAEQLITKDELVQEFLIDMEVTASQFKIGLVEQLERLKPFGYGNRKPVLMVSNAIVIEKKSLGSSGKHLKLKFKDKGIGIGECVMFNCSEDLEKIQKDDILDLAGSLTINSWNGNIEVQFIVNEWRRSE